MKTHRHQWQDHCDCEYCNLERCLKCGDERDKKEVWRPNSRTKVTQTIHCDGISQVTYSTPPATAEREGK